MKENSVVGFDPILKTVVVTHADIVKKQMLCAKGRYPEC